MNLELRILNMDFQQTKSLNIMRIMKIMNHFHNLPYESMQPDCLSSQARIEPSSNGLYPWGGQWLLSSVAKMWHVLVEDDPKIQKNMRNHSENTVWMILSVCLNMFKWWFKV